MPKRRVVAAAILLVAVVATSAPALDNTVREGARKVEGGAREVGKSAGEIGTKAGKAIEGAARDTRSALGKAWDNVVQGLKNAFK